jgi:metallo-beta-lactamase family protein
MTVTMDFHGAAGSVTGSCYRIVHPKGSFLVDCGMFQGSKTLNALNHRPLPFDPREPAFVLLTHAHIDHSGMLPRLTKAGFRGPIYTTPSTTDLLTFMLPDSGSIQESEVERTGATTARPGKTTADLCAGRRPGLPSRSAMRPRAMAGSCRVSACGTERGSYSGVRVAGIEMRAGKATADASLRSGIRPQPQAFHPDPDAPEASTAS